MIRSIRAAAVAACTVLLLGASGATAFPLGLQIGDTIESLEWDAYRSNPGDGGSFTPTGPASGDADLDGRVTAITIAPAATSPLSDVNFSLNLAWDAGSSSVTPLGGGLFDIVAVFVGSPSVAPDFVISDLSGTILTADVDALNPLIIEGIVDVNNPSEVLLASGVLSITGGDANLVNAIGPTAELVIDGGLFDFDPLLSVLFGDGNPFNDSFTFDGDGILAPVTPAPFAPEPGTAVLLALGLAGLAAHRRRS